MVDSSPTRRIGNRIEAPREFPLGTRMTHRTSFPDDSVLATEGDGGYTPHTGTVADPMSFTPAHG